MLAHKPYVDMTNKKSSISCVHITTIPSEYSEMEHISNIGKHNAIIQYLLFHYFRMTAFLLVI